MDPEALEGAIRRHPWVAAVDVNVAWPGSVTIDVLEHTPVAWVQTTDSWLMTAADGSVLESVTEPDGRFPQVSVGTAAAAPGDVVDVVAVAGITFMAHLPEQYRAVARVTGTPEALTAHVGRHVVSLGHPVDMGEKALALAALLDAGVTADAPISVVSPLRPAVTDRPVPDSQLEVEGSLVDPSEASPTG